MQKISPTGKIALAVAVMLWASAFVAIRAGLKGFSPGGLALLRFLIASVFMYLIWIIPFERRRIPKKHRIYILLVGIFGIGGYNIALNYGEISVPSGMASFIVSQSPIITSLLAILFLNEKITAFGSFGMIVSMIGVVLILMGSNSALHIEIGIFYIFFATIIGGIYSILQKPFLKRYHAIDVTAYGIWGSALALLFFTPNLYHDMSHMNLNATLAAIYLGIFPAVIAYVAWNVALSELPVSRAANFLFFMPLIATLLGWIWLGEVPTALSITGGMIALAGVWIVNKSFHLKQFQKSVEI